mmetsp:Transcript_116899/g.162421  ORF Transcript_116899/g.162421 Transcript_116899/m.162421 type:complete len:230 (-) Transcript_116899:3447-4136(-)
MFRLPELRLTRTLSTSRPSSISSSLSLTRTLRSPISLSTSCPSCTTSCSSGTTLKTTTLHLDSSFLSDRFATLSSNLPATLSTVRESSPPSRTVSHTNLTTNCSLLWMSAASSRMPTLSTRLNPRTSGRLPLTLCSCVSTASLRDARTLCTSLEPSCSSTSSPRSRLVTPRVRSLVTLSWLSLTSSMKLSTSSWRSSMIFLTLRSVSLTMTSSNSVSVLRSLRDVSPLS